MALFITMRSERVALLFASRLAFSCILTVPEINVQISKRAGRETGVQFKYLALFVCFTACDKQSIHRSRKSASNCLCVLYLILTTKLCHVRLDLRIQRIFVPFSSLVLVPFLWLHGKVAWSTHLSFTLTLSSIAICCKFEAYIFGKNSPNQIFRFLFTSQARFEI